MKYPDKLSFMSQESVRATLGDIAIDIPGRTGAERRSADDRDWWCFRRWLLTMSEQEQIPSYPCHLRRPPNGAGPDFVLRFPNLGNGDIGIEVTEATCPEDQIERTRSEYAPNGIYEMGQFGGRSYESGPDSMISNDYVQHILSALDRKLAKADNYFEACHFLDMLIYVNNNAAFYVQLAEVVGVLATAIDTRVKDDHNARRIGRIVVLDHLEFGMFMDGRFRLHRTSDAS
jgi:hypothetical protein